MKFIIRIHGLEQFVPTLFGKNLKITSRAHISGYQMKGLPDFQTIQPTLCHKQWHGTAVPASIDLCISIMTYSRTRCLLTLTNQQISFLLFIATADALDAAYREANLKPAMS